MFFLFSWDKVYYIIKKEGNYNYNYFKMLKLKKCVLHNSYRCGCKLNKNEDSIKQTIEQYILIYKYCTKLFVVVDGKIKLFSIRKKLNNYKSIHNLKGRSLYQ